MLQRLKKTIKVLFFPLAVLFIATSFTGAYFSDSVSVTNNKFEAGSWGGGSAGPVAGDVVINEMMWMGSTSSSSDEWIELRNMTSGDIDLSDWQLTRISSGTQVLMLTIPSGDTIPANGYFLISNYAKSSASSSLNVDPNLVSSSVSLANSALQIKLYKGDWSDAANLIDTADDGVGVPFAGSNGTNKQSMSRKATPGDGTDINNWYTDTTSNTTAYWKTEDGNYGAPGGPNS